jgi:hypothetical protein
MAVQSSTKKWMFIGGGVIVAAALVVLFQNYPPQPKDAAGTIGAAQRYHEPQISGADVKVSQDELTTWIQSDTFDRIVKDPQARKLFTDAMFFAAVSDAAARNVAPDKATALADNDAVKVRRIAVSGDTDAGRFAILSINDNADFMKRLEKLDPSTAKVLENSFSGDGMRLKQVSLSLPTDDAVRIGKYLQVVSGENFAKVNSLAVDGDNLKALMALREGLVVRSRFLEFAENNAAIMELLNDGAMTHALASNHKLFDGLKQWALTVNPTVD